MVKVADFGLVRAVAEASSSTGDVILGTVAYLSPEQVATGAADARSDVYATGVMLFEMLTGAPPYTGETALSVAYHHVNDDMPAPSTAGAAVPAPLDDLIVRATRRDPDARPSDAAAFLRELQSVRTQLGIDRVPVPAVPTGLAGATVVRPPEHGPQATRALARDEIAAGALAPHDDLYLRERARNRRAFIAWITVVLMLASAVGVGAWWLGSGRWTVVPDLMGLQRGAVAGVLSSADLKANLTDDHNDTVPGDTVIRSDPAPGQRARRGSDINVVISLGHPVVPDVAIGSTPEEAQRAVQQADLSPRLDADAAKFDDAVPVGAVIGLQPASGTMLTVGAPVTVVLSKGPAPTRVPDVRGLPQGAALSMLSRAGLTVQVQRQFDGQIAGGHAIGTDPKAGTGAARGTNVTLLVSTASVVPSVVGLSVAQARQVLADAGLNSTVSQSSGGVGLFGGFGFLGGFSDRVVSQSPPAGRPVRPGATVALSTL
ncbi:MAG: serine/threonine protein kinase [Pseudonocardiales bacterium]|nr:MAG: serine/threonine protein kinase [Pseudonocardiales bacterium]